MGEGYRHVMLSANEVCTYESVGVNGRGIGCSHALYRVFQLMGHIWCDGGRLEQRFDFYQSTPYSRKPPESDPVLPNQPLFGPEMPPKAALKGAPKRKKSVKR